jgi:hypothetical protein
VKEGSRGVLGERGPPLSTYCSHQCQVKMVNIITYMSHILVRWLQKCQSI